MTKPELIAALAWIITAMAPDNQNAKEIFAILKGKTDMKKIVKLYKSCMDDADLRRTFFPNYK